MGALGNINHVRWCFSLVIYLTFNLFFYRSLNLEQEAQVKQQEKDKERNSLTGIVGPSTPVETSKISILLS